LFVLINPTFHSEHATNHSEQQRKALLEASHAICDMIQFHQNKPNPLYNSILNIKINTKRNPELKNPPSIQSAEI